MDWARILAYITGTVNQERLLRNEYLAAENRILKAQLKTPLRLTDAERITLVYIPIESSADDLPQSISLLSGTFGRFIEILPSTGRMSF